jgi:uncharacterized lipoprotein
MKANLFVLAGVAAVLVNACGFTPKEQAAGNFDYLEVKNDVQLQPAPGKQLPPVNKRYEVPQPTHNTPLGENVVVLAPKLVWPVANGSRVDEDETKTRVYFDELDGMNDVENFVWQGLLQGIETRGWNIVEQQEKQRLVIGWLPEEFEYGEDDTDVEIQRQFEITMNTAEHGRTTALLSTVLQREVNSGSEAIDELYLTHRDNDAAAQVLNTLVSEIAITQAKGVASVTDDGSVNIQAGFDEDGYASIIVSASFNFTWGVMKDVLNELGFEVDDYNQQTGRYYASYDAESTGNSFAFWRESNGARVALPSGDYEIKVTGDRQKTSVTLFRDGQAISPAQVSDIFAPFAAEIRNQSSL